MAEEMPFIKKRIPSTKFGYWLCRHGLHKFAKWDGYDVYYCLRCGVDWSQMFGYMKSSNIREEKWEKFTPWFGSWPPEIRK